MQKVFCFFSPNKGTIDGFMIIKSIWELLKDEGKRKNIYLKLKIINEGYFFSFGYKSTAPKKQTKAIK